PYPDHVLGAGLGGHAMILGCDPVSGRHRNLVIARPPAQNSLRRRWGAPDGEKPQLAGVLHGRAAVVRAELGVDAAYVGVDRVDGDVERSGDLGPREVRRQEPQHPQLARAELVGWQWTRPVAAWRRCASQEVSDVGEQRAVRRLMRWEHVEELASVAHSEREDQPI